MYAVDLPAISFWRAYLRDDADVAVVAEKVVIDSSLLIFIIILFLMYESIHLAISMIANKNHHLIFFNYRCGG